ncbi:pilus assembly protein [Phototrophicus methaneseepsis]|uniref:Pilus assembly protein n=1 Tax=Phototrophicus methaneseepsis TaxID=2710758 RepID=A0A7S8ICS9_9CHLR|nr:TadE/TadG family type IV pilus assembly protein [Phototrophicus methaneseepsis]QPC80624.1 pilus assembly protein [Phototrophicus methaneseepsis]
MREISPDESRRLRRGQTLAEFGISLPLLLILLFSIVEFGRLFQSWVTIQNAARAASRYAVTGRYNEERYDIELILPCTTDLTSANLFKDTVDVPYVTSDGTQIRTVNIYNSNVENGEDIYATWYGGAYDEADEADCFPSAQSLDRREDLLRLASIYDEAWDAAAGLLRQGVETGSGSRDDFKNWLYSYWSNPSPASFERGWFYVGICSTRERLFESRLTDIDLIDSAAKDFRFYEVSQGTHGYYYGACVLQEDPKEDVAASASILDQYGIPWADAGSGGQRVMVTIVYNHPLITPLAFTPYLQMSARRAAVNEAFRITNAERALGPTNPGGPGLINPTPATNTPQVEETETPTEETETPTEETETPPTVPEPFSCDKISVYTEEGTAYKNPSSITLNVRNDNREDTYITRSILNWNSDKLKRDFPNVYVGYNTINDDVYWHGTDRESPTDTGTEPTYYPGANRRVYGNGQISEWQALFVSGPVLLVQSLAPWDFSGSTFYFDHPDEPTDCIIPIEVPAAPVPTSTPEDFVPTATFTPNCASSTLTVEFVSFDPLGDVRFRIINNRPVPSNLLDFNIVWRPISGLSLSRVVVGGNSVNDVPPTGSGVLVWRNDSGGDTAPPTLGSSASDGQWITDYTFPANTSTYVHLDFTGLGAPPLSDFGASPSDFNGSWFEISCGSMGPGSGGPGSLPSDKIFPSEKNTPTITPTVAPTSTPVPTNPPTPVTPTTPPPATTPPTTRPPTTQPPTTPPTTPPPTEDDDDPIIIGPIE